MTEGLPHLKIDCFPFARILRRASRATNLEGRFDSAAAVDDLAAFIYLVLKNFDELRGVFLYAAGAEPITMRDVLLSIGAAQGREPQSFRCPVRLPFMPCVPKVIAS